MVIQNGKWYSVVGLCATVFFIWYVVVVEARGDILKVVFLDVGQGDAIYIEAPNGNQFLIDGGGNNKVLRSLSRVMPFYDRSIDVVLATHPDKDHIGGLPAVAERFSVDFFVDTGVVSESGAFKALFNILKTKKTSHVIAERGQTIVLDDGVELSILFPDRDVSGIETNSASIVAQLIYGDTTFLFTGDSPKNIEKYLVSLDGKRLESDVLKVGHHGSKTSTDGLFLGFVSPEYAVISAGSNNRYGHPHLSVLDTLEQFGVEVLQTAQDSNIVFFSDGERVWRKK